MKILTTTVATLALALSFGTAELASAKDKGGSGKGAKKV
jgi:hypothetical protein